MAETEMFKRVAFSPGEFATLFGKSQTWGYRQIYAGKVNAITEHGRILIPAQEVEKILQKAGIYNGVEKPKKKEPKLEKLTAEQKNVWQLLVARHRNNQPKAKKGVESLSKRLGHTHPRPSPRAEFMGRLTAAKKRQPPEI